MIVAEQQLGITLDEMIALTLSTRKHYSESLLYMREVLGALTDYIGELLTAIFVADRNLDFLELEVLAAFDRALTAEEMTQSQLLEQVAQWLKQRDDSRRPLTALPGVFEYLIASDRIDGEGRATRLIALSEQLGNIAINADGRACAPEYQALESNLRTLNLAMNWRSGVDEAERDLFGHR